MGGLILRNAKLHITSDDFAEADAIAIQNHRITPVDPSLFEDGTSEEINLNGLHVAPGLIDLHVNGCNSVTFSVDPTVDTLETMRRYLSQKGTLTFVPTLVSGPRETMTRALQAVSEFRSQHPGVCPGIHLEGPFINGERKGFHPVGYIRPLTDADVTNFRENQANIAYMTIAPEIIKPKGILDLLSANIKLSMGHSNAGFMEALNAMRQGVNCVTHIFNGMRHMNGREPGIPGVAFNFEEMFSSIIADGRHVHPAMIRMAHKLMGDRLFIVSDAQAAAGAPEGLSSFFISGTEIFVDKMKGLVDSKGALAGTSISLLDSIKFLVRVCGFSLDDALAAATKIPARFMGIDNEYGTIADGFMADLIIFDNEFKIRYVVQNGFIKSAAELL